MKKVIQKIILLAFSGLFCIFLLEFALKIMDPSDTHRVAEELPQYAHLQGGEDSKFTIDPEFGFRPKIGTGLYNEYGTKLNDYSLEKPEGKTRILCMGDSVMARHIMLDAIIASYGNSDYEFWNAGVESFNVVQEVKLYKKYNAPINPDQVVLFFHNNDFSTTPVAVPTDDGSVRLFMPRMPAVNINPWLFKNSRIYRRVLALKWQQGDDQSAVVEEVRESFVELNGLLSEKGVPFKVVLLPIMKKLDEWKPYQLENRELAITLLNELEIPWIDLMPALTKAVEDGIPLPETPGDGWHPSPELSAYFAELLKAEQMIVE